METLALIVRAGFPPTPEEEARLRNFPSRSPEELLERLRPSIARTTHARRTPLAGRGSNSSDVNRLTRDTRIRQPHT